MGVFEKMLESPLVESSTRIVTIEDFSIDSVKCFLEILYSGQSQSACKWGDILLLADKYQLPDVVKVALNKMQTTVDAETVVPYLGAINKTLHLSESKESKDTLIEKIRKDKKLVLAMADAF